MRLNKKFLAITTATIATLLTACAPKEEVIMTLGDHELTKDEFYVMLRDETYSDGLTFGDIIMEQHLLVQILEDKYGDKVSQEYVDAEIEGIIEHQGGEEAFNEMLESEDITKDKIENDIRTQGLILEAYKEYFPLDEDILELEYEEMIPTGRRIAHILVADSKTADEVLKKLDEGEDFAELVKEYSTDEGSVDSDGEYTLVRDYFVPEFEEAALALAEVGEISKPVESDYGYHIVTLVDEGVKGTFEEEKDNLLNSHYQEKMHQDQDSYSEIMTNLLNEYESMITITDDALEDLVSRIINNLEEMKKSAEEEEALDFDLFEDEDFAGEADGGPEVIVTEEVIEEPDTEDESNEDSSD